MTKNKNQAKKSVCLQSLPLIHPHTAGIDVGAKEHVVAVPADRDPQPVRSFKAFTPDLYELADWLKQSGVETVALESTGIYWSTLYEILEERGFAVPVVNARHVKNVPPLPVHDAILFQAPRESAQVVKDIVRQVMCDSFHEILGPDFSVAADTNISERWGEKN